MAAEVMPSATTLLAGLEDLFPEARCELDHRSEIELLVAIMLSAQTTDAAVNRATPALFARFRDAADYAAASPSEIETYIVHLGLHHAKAKNLHAAMTIIAAGGGRIVADQQALEALPGVGRKTANVFLAEARGVPRIAVDTHVARVSVRLGLAEAGDAPAAIERKLEAVFPETDWIRLHHLLIFFGRYFCTARRPRCGECPFRGFCTYDAKV